jgi:hypothetical protein
MPNLNPIQATLLAAAIIWSLTWKGVALWKASKIISRFGLFVYWL